MMNSGTNPNERNPSDCPEWQGPPVAVFWDQSLVWGLICLAALESIDVPYQLLNGSDIASGALETCRVLVVPGGWASHKIRALGDEGSRQIRHFVETGGGYLGFCGGAGLALSSPPSLNLVPLGRIPLSRRLPNASGEVWIAGTPHHPAWSNLPLQIPVSVWWPSQFDYTPSEGISCIASYADTGKDFYVADLAVADLEREFENFEEWERTYGINLNPARLIGHPAILEAELGRGAVVLSYPHLETPGDRWGNILFRNLLDHLDNRCSGKPRNQTQTQGRLSKADSPPTHKSLKHLAVALDSTESLIRFGERHLLWNWRNPWLLRWRRGIRGLEYGTLAVTLAFLLRQLQGMVVPGTDGDPWYDSSVALESCVVEFCDKARTLLLEEKLSAQSGKLTKLGTVNEKVDGLRAFLFGDRMNHGGVSRKLFDLLDTMLFHTLLLQKSPLCLFMAPQTMKRPR